MKKLILSLAALSLLIASCSKSINGDVEYIPFQETSDGQWGMISMTGKVLFEDEFKNKPTIVRDGRFFVRTKDGVWEMYDASEKPKKIGADYAHTSGFRNGIALVAEKGKPVTIIDVEGKTIKLLDKIDGKEVHGVRSYEEGYAVFMTIDSLYGVIDSKGNCVIKPEYCSLTNCSDNKFIGVKDKYKKYVAKDQKDKVKISVIDKSGELLFDFNGDKYEDTAYGFVDGLLPISVKKDGKSVWGIINEKGEAILKPSSKIKSIGSIHGDRFTYSNGDGWGLMNIKGETIIRAKYDALMYGDDNILIAADKEDGSFNYKYIDENDDQIGEETYVRATYFSMFDGEHAVVKPNDKIYSIIDKKGNQIEGLPDMVNMGTYEGENYIESDYLDIDKFVKDARLSVKGIFGFSFESKAKDIVDEKVKLDQAASDENHPAGSPYWYDYTDKLELYKDVDGVSVLAGFNFSGKLSRETYKTQRIIDYEIGDYYWYHDKKIPTGYIWNPVKLQSFSAIITNSGRMHGKLRDMFKVIVSKFKKHGTVAKENNGAVFLELNGGNRALIALNKSNVMMICGDLKDAKDIDIDKYKDASEEDNPDNLSYGYLNNLFPDEVRADSVEVDSIAAE